ncbi:MULTISPECIES: DUF1439 domain-containing protein [unclassified Pseudoalteromonas]|uniref:DUF1439 domain-containing protein n=1 Tax=unclassified Pseudoalteromonas TaxID=194690 RepID=UPI000CF693EA|nr:MULTISPECIES: DUF1439 domain-containing protein [unclassified Pseudoalteromonas]
MKQWIMGMVLACVALLGGCASHAPLSVFSLTSGELEQSLLQQSDRYGANATVMGVPMELTVNDIGVQIGPEQSPNGIELALDNTVMMQALALKVPVRVRLNIAAVPYFNGDEDAIYLQDFKILNADIDAMGYRGKLAPLSEEVQQLLTQALSQYPVYSLNKQDPKQALLARFKLALEVNPGVITLTSGL